MDDQWAEIFDYEDCTPSYLGTCEPEKKGGMLGTVAGGSWVWVRVAGGYIPRSFT